jgi:polyisoprenoid-binding protein YceI
VVGAQVRAAFGSREFARGDEDKLAGWLTEEVRPVGLRDEHLRSNDFFDMLTYPEITFTSTAVEHGGGDSCRVTGDLSIKSTTKPVTLDVKFTAAAHDPMGNDRIGFEIGYTVHRKDRGITWNAPLEAGGVLVGDKVTPDIDVSAVKRSG